MFLDQINLSSNDLWTPCTRHSQQDPVKLDILRPSHSHHRKRPGGSSAILIRHSRQLTGEYLQQTLRLCLDRAQEINSSPDRHIPKQMWAMGVGSLKVDRDGLWLQHEARLTEAIKCSQTGVQQAAALSLMTGEMYKQPQSGFESGQEEHDTFTESHCFGVCKFCQNNTNNTTGVWHNMPVSVYDLYLRYLYFTLKFAFLRLLLVHCTSSIPFHALSCHTHTQFSGPETSSGHHHSNMFGSKINRNKKEGFLCMLLKPEWLSGYWNIAPVKLTWY